MSISRFDIAGWVDDYERNDKIEKKGEKGDRGRGRGRRERVVEQNETVSAVVMLALARNER